MALAKPGWQGWGTIISAMSLVATILVALLVYRLSEINEDQRQAQLESSLSPSVFVTRYPGTDVWKIALVLVNQGPSATQPTAIHVQFGGPGIEANGYPEMENGEVVWLSILGDLDCFDQVVTVRSEGGILPGDAIRIQQEFLVAADRDQQLQAESGLGPISLIQEDGTYAEGLFYTWRSGDSTHRTLAGAFLARVDAKGGNVEFEEEWQLDDPECPSKERWINELSVPP